MAGNYCKQNQTSTLENLEIKKKTSSTWQFWGKSITFAKGLGLLDPNTGSTNDQTWTQRLTHPAGIEPETALERARCDVSDHLDTMVLSDQ